MVQLELSYLHELGRLTIGGADILSALQRRIRLRRSDLPSTHWSTPLRP
jgi:hypothetical protein